MVLAAATLLLCGIGSALALPRSWQPRAGSASALTTATTALVRARPGLVTLTVAVFLAYGALQAIIVVRVARFTSTGIPVEDVVWWAALSGLLSLPARWLLPRLADRVESWRLLVGVMAVLTAGTLAALGGGVRR